MPAVVRGFRLRMARRPAPICVFLRARPGGRAYTVGLPLGGIIERINYGSTSPPEAEEGPRGSWFPRETLRVFFGKKTPAFSAENAGAFGGSGWVRTTVVVRQQIYSLPPLATWVRSPISILFVGTVELVDGFEPPTC